MDYLKLSSFMWIVFSIVGLLSKNISAQSKEHFRTETSPAEQNWLLRHWSDWTSWSECSRTCGGGVRMRTRVCKISQRRSYNAFPGTCLGETTEYELCARQNCSPYDEEFLNYQCSQRNGQSVGGESVREWIPHRYGKNSCELQCLAKGQSLVYSFGKVIDGTKCATNDPYQPALCVNGRCMPVDCAGYIGSDNRLDRCGVCRGNNSTCVKYQNTFWRRPRERVGGDGSKDHHYDYDEIASIPAGATHILVEEHSQSNFLALADHKGTRYINGNWRIQSPGHFVVHGTNVLYNRTWDGHESFSITGPTRFEIFLFVLGSGDIPTIHYEYWISKDRLPSSIHRLLPMNQIRSVENIEKPSHPSKESKPAGHTLYGNTPKSVVPQSKQGYRSYYHRNEILKSVPSWSFKRHSNYKKSSYSSSSFPSNITSGTYTKISTRLRLLDSDKKNDENIKSLYSPKSLEYREAALVVPSETVNTRNKGFHLDMYGRPVGTSALTKLNHSDKNLLERANTKGIVSQIRLEVPNKRSGGKITRKALEEKKQCNCLKVKNRKKISA